MPILQLPSLAGTHSEIRGPDNEEDNSEFNDNNNMNQYVRLFDYHCKIILN